MLIASLLYYKKFLNNVKGIGFWQNNYDPCVANRTVRGKQHTICWHVDNIKLSHVEPKVNDEFHEWLQTKYGEDNIGKVKSIQGTKHDYLAIVFDYSTPGKLKLDMRDYVERMIDDFPYNIPKTNSPWNENLFKVDEGEKNL